MNDCKDNGNVCKDNGNDSKKTTITKINICEIKNQQNGGRIKLKKHIYFFKKSKDKIKKEHHTTINPKTKQT